MAVLRRTNEEHEMPGNPREIITMAERRFPVRIRIAVPPDGLGRRHAQMTAWLDENCRADGWAMTPSGIRGTLKDAVLLHFADADPPLERFRRPMLRRDQGRDDRRRVPGARGRAGAAGRGRVAPDVVNGHRRRVLRCWRTCSEW
jgi:hypothetical protein